MTKQLLVSIEGGVANLTLNRPASGNALDMPLARDLLEAAIRCDQDEAIRCVVLIGLITRAVDDTDLDAERKRYVRMLVDPREVELAMWPMSVGLPVRTANKGRSCRGLPNSFRCPAESRGPTMILDRQAVVRGGGRAVHEAEISVVLL